MSRNTLEAALYRLTMDRTDRQAFRRDARGWLAATPLDQTEVRQVTEFDVAALVAGRVNPMLVMGFWLACEPSRSMRGYLRKLRAGPVQDEYSARGES